MFTFDGGIRIEETDLWLDASHGVNLGYVSHAHADHMRRHKKVIATPITAQFYQQRIGANRSFIHTIPFHQPVEIDSVTVELFPSGHMLGASQILVVKDNVRLVYTGDFNMYPGETSEPIAIRSADILIMEATFGLPQYRFPPRWQIIGQLIDFVDRCFEQNLIPVILAYSVGKSQEVIKILGDRNYSLSVYKTTAQMTSIYKSCGVELRNWQPFSGENLNNRVVIIPPRLLNWIQGLYPGKVKSAMVTGWAVDRGAKYRYKVDEMIPLSDHADFIGLLTYVEKVDPAKIYVTHGFSEFVQVLKEKGYQAAPLKPEPQLSLF